MKIYPEIKLKKLAETDSGELVQIDAEGAYGFFIVVQPSIGQPAICALVKLSEDEPPHADQYSGNTQCVSYGTDWILDLRQGSIHDAQERLAGDIEIRASETVMRLKVRDSQSPRFVNLSSWAYNTPSTDECVAISGWRIWHNSAAMQLPASIPLIAFGVD